MPYKSYEDTKASTRARYHARKAAEPDYLEKRRIKQRSKRLNNKKVVLAHYGACCARCGIDEIRVLDIDHIHNNGHEEGHNRSHLADGLVTGLRKWEDYQLLCSNCNRLKYYEWVEAQGRTFCFGELDGQ